MKAPRSLEDFRGKNILVMGLGVHGGGLGVARFMARNGAHVRVTDLRSPELLAAPMAQIAEEGLPIEYTLGEHREEDFRWADMVVRNPGVPRESKWLKLARSLGKPIEMEISLFLELCPGTVIGVTGTKGKSTTATWTWEMVRRHKPNAVLAGNLRVSALEALPSIESGTPVILELSSFQLEGLEEPDISPHLAAVTNLSPDHLDRYPSMKEYGEAKKHIFTHQRADKGDWVVLNRDDPEVAAWAEDAPAGAAWFGLDGLERILPGVYVGEAALVYYPLEGNPVSLVGLDRVKLPGSHSLLNGACAAMLAILAQVPIEGIKEALSEFGGVADRMEFVATLDGVRFINDTTATAPAAAIAALRSLDGPLVLIAGGAQKNLDFSELAPVAAERARSVVLLDGTATDLMEQEFRAAGVHIAGRFSDFEEAIREAWRLAPSGGTVLLSPGTASFGMFLNEFHRGERFREIVRRLVENPPARPA